MGASHGSHYSILSFPVELIEVNRPKQLLNNFLG